jgi:hypothetical protein
VDDQQYTNQFAEVHRKVKVFKDLAREANEHDSELRESRLVREAKETIDGKWTHLKGSQ